MDTLTRRQRRELKRLGIELTEVKASTTPDQFEVIISCKVDGMPEIAGIASRGSQKNWTHEELFEQGIRSIIGMVRVQRVTR